MEQVAPKNSVTQELEASLQSALKYNKMGVILFKAKKYKMAISQYLKAIALLEGHHIPLTNAYMNIGTIQAELKSYPEALESFKKVVDLSPHNDPNLSRTADPVLYRLMMHSQLNSKDAYKSAFSNIAYCLLGLERPKEAIAYCKKAIELDPTNNDARINYGNALRQSGLREEANEMCWQMLKDEVFKRSKGEVELEVEVVDLQTLEVEPRNDEEQVNIITLKYGTKYGPEYVNKLLNGFKRNTERNFKFICFTDDPRELEPEIEVRELPEDWKRLCGKAMIFRPENDFEGLNFFIDLDMIITGNLDKLLDFPGKFALMRTDEIQNEVLNKGGYNSSVLLWRGSHFSSIYRMMKVCFEIASDMIFR